MTVFLPQDLFDSYKCTVPDDEAEWLVVDPTPESPDEKGDSFSPVSPPSTASDASWQAFCTQSPRPLVIEDDSSDLAPSKTVHLTSVAQAPILSPAVPEPEVAAVHPEPVQQATPRVVNYYPLWSSRGGRGAGYRGRPRACHPVHVLTPAPRRAAESSTTRGRFNKRRGNGTNSM